MAKGGVRLRADHRSPCPKRGYLAMRWIRYGRFFDLLLRNTSLTTSIAFVCVVKIIERHYKYFTIAYENRII